MGISGFSTAVGVDVGVRLMVGVPYAALRPLRYAAGVLRKGCFAMGVGVSDTAGVMVGVTVSNSGGKS